MERKSRIDAFGATTLIVFSALLGLNQVFVKMVNAGMAPVFQAGFRSFCAIVPVLLYALWAKKRLSISDGSFVPGILCGIFFAVEFMLLFGALDYTSVSRSSVFFYTMPFWVSIGAHFLIPGDRLTLLKIVGLILAIVGVAVAMLNNDQPTTKNALIGDLMALTAATGWAAIALIIRTTKLSKSSPEMQLLYQLAVSALIMLPIAFASGETFREMTPALTGIFAFQVLGVVGIGFVVWFWVLSIYPASDMASFGFLAPLFGILFGWLILDEAITIELVVAMALVSLGIVLVNRKPKVTKP